MCVVVSLAEGSGPCAILAQTGRSANGRPELLPSPAREAARLQRQVEDANASAFGDVAAAERARDAALSAVESAVEDARRAEEIARRRLEGEYSSELDQRLRAAEEERRHASLLERRALEARHLKYKEEHEKRFPSKGEELRQRWVAHQNA